MARVVPNIPSFAVDDGFWYSIPGHLAADVKVGSIVRVPLSGRRVRGWVVEVAAGHQGELKDIAGVSGAMPVFDEDLLKALTWASHHYVAPLQVLLARATPPNLPRRKGEETVGVVSGSPGPHLLRDVAVSAARGRKRPATAMVGRWQELGWLESLRPVVEAGRSAVVIAASGAEADLVASGARSGLGETVVAVVGEGDASVTRAWERAQAPGRLVVGTPRVSTWMVANLALAIVLEEGRRAMKDRQTPTLHVRDVMRSRSRIEGWTLVFFGPTPSVELLAAGAEVSRIGNRAWPLVEVVDRSEDQPGTGYLSERVLAALRATVRNGGRCFIFTHRRVGYASMRCVRCRAVRGCSVCGSRLGRVAECPRCGAGVGPCASCGGTEFEEMGTIPERLAAEVDRRLGRSVAGREGDGHAVMVGTERDLAGLAPVSLAVAADADGMLEGAGYRDSEEALRQLARVANSVERGPGHRMMVQTSTPHSDLMAAIRRGDPIPYLESVLVERARDGMPPSSEMIAVEVRGDQPESIFSDLESLPAVSVLGPAQRDGAQRWLITGNLRGARAQLRSIAGRWRESGATVRIDADPIDL